MTTPVIEEFVYPHAELPRLLEQQVWDFARLIWGGDLIGDRRFRARMFDEPPPVHFVRAAGDLLIAHAQVLPLRFRTDAGELRVGGVGAVLAYPQFRREGHATALMRRAAEHIRETADLGMLFCDVSSVPFYGRLGWVALPAGQVLLHDEVRGDVVMVLGEPDLLPDPFRLEWSW